MRFQACSDPIWQTILDHVEEAVVVYDKDGGLAYWNKKFKELYAYTDDELSVGIHFSELGRLDVQKGNVAIGDDIGEGAEYLARKAEYRARLKGSFFVHLKDGRWIKTTDRRLPDGGFVSVQTEVTELRQLYSDLMDKNDRLAKANDELQRALNTDFLTGALSREAIISQVEKILLGEPEDEVHRYAMLVDLDHFKTVNDTHGHLIGDQVLQDLAAIARRHSASINHFGRMGGDEFLGIVNVENGTCPTDFFHMFKSDFDQACAEYRTSSTGQVLGLSAGFSRIDEETSNFSTLYHKLDQALYRAKALGKHTAVVV